MSYEDSTFEDMLADMTGEDKELRLIEMGQQLKKDWLFFFFDSLACVDSDVIFTTQNHVAFPTEHPK